MREWGRWRIDGDFLIYVPAEGELDPKYELKLSTLLDAPGREDWRNHLREKAWIKGSDLADFEAACRAIEETRTIDQLGRDSSYVYSREYLDTLQRDWRTLLAEGDSSSESLYQQYLELNPSLLPGPHGTPLGRYHGPPLGLAFSQPELPGFRAKRPDFLILERDSARVYAVLIELEAPGKRWCTNRAVPTADLTQAIDQLREWKAWFSKPVNVLQFIDLYDLEDDVEVRRLVPHYVLVYGRRDDAKRLPSFAQKRADLEGPDEYFMSYDRLQPSGLADLTVKLDRSGPDKRFRAVAVAPTFELDQWNAEFYCGLLDAEEALRANPLMPSERLLELTKRYRAAQRYVTKLRRANRHREFNREEWF